MSWLDADIADASQPFFDVIIERNGWEALSDVQLVEAFEALLIGQLSYGLRRKALHYFTEYLKERARSDSGELGESLPPRVFEQHPWPDLPFDQPVKGIVHIFTKPKSASMPSGDDDEAPSRALIDQLIADTRLYSTGAAIKELLDFTARLRNIAPFNAMLLHIQKPGLSYAMTRYDWWDRFRRRPKEHARPLVILRTFGPVDFVYDVLDTEGKPLPPSAYSFPTSGSIPADFLCKFDKTLSSKAIDVLWLDRGDRSAGFARRLTSHGDKDKFEHFEIGLNRNHDQETQFVSLIHELAHILLGHCGADKKRKVEHHPVDTNLAEVEAETVAYVVSKRSGVAPRSDSYLDMHKDAFVDLDLHRVLKCSNSIERLLGLPLGIK